MPCLTKYNEKHSIIYHNPEIKSLKSLKINFLTVWWNLLLQVRTSNPLRVDLRFNRRIANVLRTFSPPVQKPLSQLIQLSFKTTKERSDRANALSDLSFMDLRGSRVLGHSPRNLVLEDLQDFCFWCPPVLPQFFRSVFC